MYTLLCCVMVLLVCPAFAEQLALTPEAWDNRNPLGGSFTNGTYSCLGEAANSFAVSRTVPVSSNVAVAATYTPKTIVGPNFKTAAIVLRESSMRYWQLALVETPAGRRHFELCEMRDGQWHAQKDLKREIDKPDGTWKLGEPLRLSLSMDGKGVEGAVCAADGRLVFRRRFALDAGAVACGRPALRCRAISGVYSDVEATYGTPCVVADDADVAETFPKYVSAVQAVAPPGDSPAQATGFFRTEKASDGRWWFVDPNGKTFFLTGADAVSSTGDHNAKLGYSPYGRTVQRKYHSVDVWATNTLARLTSWGFNMVVSSEKPLLHRRLPHSRILYIGSEMSTYGDYEILPWDGGPCSAFPNVFSPKFEKYCRYVARTRCAPCKDDPWLIGWYIDNELAWWGDKRKFRTSSARGLFNACARKPAGHSARVALERFLAERGVASPEAATDEVTREFVRLIARRYFEISARAIREADPNHLILGCRFAGLQTSDPGVWEECGRYCDVVSVNVYPEVDLDRGVVRGSFADEFAAHAAMAGKPVIVTEWSFVALDSGLPCMRGAGQRFFTQRERAEASSILARTFFALPGCAGYVFFKWSDQPAYGAKSEKSENCNYGLVDANDNAWLEQVAALAAIQNDPMKWRYAPLPQARPVLPPSAEAVARAAVRDTSVRCVFAREADGTFAMSNGLVRLAGRIGARGVAVDDMGVFSPSVREYAGDGAWWSGAAEVVDVRGETQDVFSVMDVTFRGNTEAGPFEVCERFYLPTGQPFFIAELRSITNRGGRALPVDTAYFRLLPKEHAGVRVAIGDEVLEPPKDGQPAPIPPSLWRPWHTAAWELSDGTCLGLATPRQTGVTVRFWEDEKLHLHPDASVSFSRVELAPDDAFGVPGRPFVLGACCRDGLSTWHGLCKELREDAAIRAVTEIYKSKAKGAIQ